MGQVTDEMFMTEEQILEKKGKFEEKQARLKREEAAQAEAKRQWDFDVLRKKKAQAEKLSKEEEDKLQEEEEAELERQRRKKIDDELADKMKKAEESKLVIMPAILPKK